MTSRFITHPDIVSSTNNHPVLVIDATQSDLEDIALFCKVSNEDFDIYLYHNTHDDLSWLARAYDSVMVALLAEDSNVTITPADNIIKFGSTQELKHPLHYFQQYDTQGE